jgi:5-methylcytosine-specific restriction endonuclease McrA
MARCPNPPSKGRIQQTLKQQAARALAKMRTRNPGHPNWLVRHVERQNGRCAYCGIPVFLPPGRGKADRRATLDHVVPLARGGPDSEANTVAACEACNAAKADMSAQAFRLSAFYIARKAYAATVPERKAVTLTVTVRKRRRT